MVKNPMNKQSYSEEYDIPALEEIAAMAKRYIAEENGVYLPGRDVPDGSYSDFSCNVWELIANAVRFGVTLANNPDYIRKNHRWAYHI